MQAIQQRKRKVSFSTAEPAVHEFERVPKEWRSNVWISRDGFKAMRNRNMLLIAQARCGKFIEGKRQTMRGLEGRNKGQMARVVVLTNQEEQREEGDVKPEVIASCYKTACESFQLEAREKAQKDEQIANKIHSEPSPKYFPEDKQRRRFAMVPFQENPRSPCTSNKLKYLQLAAVVKMSACFVASRLAV